MTPQNPPTGPSGAGRPSGNPQKQQTVKQQRAQQREAKVEAFKKERARKARNKKIGIVSAIVGGVAIIALVVFAVSTTIPRFATYAGGGKGDTSIEGLETFTNTNNHTEDTVDYAQTPPAGGDHNAIWLNCGIYTEPVPNENAVHVLEHGAIWVTYDPSMSDEDLATLKSKLPASYVLLSPFEGLDSNFVLSAWDAQLKLDDVNDPRIADFFTGYWKGGTAPEIGAPCSGGIDAPGKV